MRTVVFIICILVYLIGVWFSTENIWYYCLGVVPLLSVGIYYRRKDYKKWNIKK